MPVFGHFNSKSFFFVGIERAFEELFVFSDFSNELFHNPKTQRLAQIMTALHDPCNGGVVRAYLNIPVRFRPIECDICHKFWHLSCAGMCVPVLVPGAARGSAA